MKWKGGLMIFLSRVEMRRQASIWIGSLPLWCWLWAMSGSNKRKEYICVPWYICLLCHRKFAQAAKVLMGVNSFGVVSLSNWRSSMPLHYVRQAYPVIKTFHEILSRVWPISKDQISMLQWKQCGRITHPNLDPLSTGTRENCHNLYK